MAEIPVRGAAAKPDVLSATTPGAGDVVSKLQRYLTDKRRVSSKKAAKLLADAIDDYLEEAPSSAEEADDLIEQIRNAGVQGKSPEEIAEALAEMIEARSERGNADHLEKFLRDRVDARLDRSG